MNRSRQPHQLAILISAPQEGQSAMYNDMSTMSQALQTRGFSADQILCLHGRLDRQVVAAFLQAASRRVASWTGGSVFLYVSGSGFFDGETAPDARPGLLFDDTDIVTDDHHLYWDDLFNILALPAGVRLTLLPDL